MYTAKIGDAFIEIARGGQKCSKWKLISKNKIESVHRFSSTQGYDSGTVLDIDYDSLNKWIKEGWFVLCKEHKVKKLLTKLDEINLR